VNFAGTNWLVSACLEARPDDEEAVRRRSIVERFLRRYGGPLAVSQVVLLEARNVFLRVTGERDPNEWRRVEADFGGRLYVDSMNWDLLRRECNALFAKYAWKAVVGTFDTAIVASARLAGGTRFLSFDVTARGLAAAEGIELYPALGLREKPIVIRLKQSR
jgi:hypothetical protein